jgi:Holliday junction DNA helicase RuvA
VRCEDSKTLANVPGIGKKTAERLIVDLKGKLKITAFPKNNTNPSKIQDALKALLNLGCPPSNAEHAVKLALDELSEECELSLLITTALKHQHRTRLP